MAATSQFCFPVGADPAGLGARLAKELGLRRLNAQMVRRVYLDTFDWRLYKRGWLLRVDTIEEETAAQLLRLDGEFLAATRLKGLPALIDELPAGKLRATLAPVIDVRALLPQVSLQIQMQPFAACNRHDKTVARLILEAAEVNLEGGSTQPLAPLLQLTRVRGYPKAARRLTAALEAAGLVATTTCPLLPALAAHGRVPGDYDNRLDVPLAPEMTAGEALRKLLASLLQSMEANWPGTRDDVDSEFLHDFRVAVRRTRTLLRSLPDVFRKDRIARHIAEFKWLGGVTSTPRDLDVLLIELPHYAREIPAARRAELAPIAVHAESHRRRTQEQLAEALQSRRYRDLVRAWRRFVGGVQVGRRGRLPVTQVASWGIWRAYKRVYRDGRKVHDDTPTVELHELRKRCKQLRYLIEAHRSLYPANELSSWIADLKRLQTILGEIQDLDVHGNALRGIARELPGDDSATPPALIALGATIEAMERRRKEARRKLAKRLTKFVSRSSRKAAEHLFVPQQDEGGT